MILSENSVAHRNCMSPQIVLRVRDFKRFLYNSWQIVEEVLMGTSKERFGLALKKETLSLILVIY